VLNCTRIVPELYLNRTCSVHSSVRSTFRRRNCGLGTEQVRPRCGEGAPKVLVGAIEKGYTLYRGWLHPLGMIATPFRVNGVALDKGERRLPFPI